MFSFHPLTIIFYTICLFLISIAYYNPLYVISILIFLVMNIIVLNQTEKLKKSSIYSLYTMIAICIINALFSQNGQIILYKSSKLPIIGKVKITLEALCYGINSSLKFFCVIIIFLIYDIMTDKDDNFSFFSRYANKLTLTMSLTTNIIHRLKLEISRIKDVMILRGANFNEKNLIKKIKVYYPILKIVLISTLEGSLDRAEALYSKGYGKNKRSTYFKISMKKKDYVLNFLSLILLCLITYGLFFNAGYYDFYDKIINFTYKDIVLLIYINIVLYAQLLLIWGCSKWKFLRYRI